MLGVGGWLNYSRSSAVVSLPETWEEEVRRLPPSTQHPGENLSSADNNITHTVGEEEEEEEEEGEDGGRREVWKLTKREKKILVL